MNITSMNQIVTPQLLVEFIKNTKYGYLKQDGTYETKEFARENMCDTIIQTPQQVFSSKICICWDQTAFEAFIFDNYIKLPYNIYYTEHKIGFVNASHTFLIYKKNNRFYWMDYNKIYDGDNEADLILQYIDKLKNKYRSNNKSVILRKIKKIPYGMNCLDFMEYCRDEGINIDSLLNPKSLISKIDYNTKIAMRNRPEESNNINEMGIFDNIFKGIVVSDKQIKTVPIKSTNNLITFISQRAFNPSVEKSINYCINYYSEMIFTGIDYKIDNDKKTIGINGKYITKFNNSVVYVYRVPLNYYTNENSYYRMKNNMKLTLDEPTVIVLKDFLSQYGWQLSVLGDSKIIPEYKSMYDKSIKILDSKIKKHYNINKLLKPNKDKKEIKDFITGNSNNIALYNYDLWNYSKNAREFTKTEESNILFSELEKLLRDVNKELNNRNFTLTIDGDWDQASVFLNISNNKINEATNIDFNDIKEIYDTLSESEQKFICEEPLVDLPYVIYRKVYTINNEKAGFIEYYKLENSNEACLVFAIKEEFRHQGLLDIMLNEAYDYAENNNDIDKIIWGCTKTNGKSYHLAEKYGFKIYADYDDVLEYYKEI